jgi:UDPglucose 6-dehydrogenase
MIGTGYVGLVSGPGLADFGNTVICADIDKEKIERLKKGHIPIYEPGLDELIQRNVKNGTLSFTHNVGKAIEDANVIFIAVGTPMDEDGSADLRYIKAVLKTISEHMNSFKLIVIKSTVPIGTGQWAQEQLIKWGVDKNRFAMVSNPEFLREGSSVHDFLYPDRIVIGAESTKAHRIMHEIYEQAFAQGAQKLSTNISTSEMIKYASNAFLAAKVSFINEIANLCDATGAQVSTVAKGMGMDHRISKHFLKAGPGFGGSCFPKDSQALIHMAHQKGITLPVIQGSLTTNEQQKVKAIEKVKKMLNVATLENKTIAVLGLAFKAHTDDIRYSPAIDVISTLQDEQAIIKTYDPQAMKNMQNIFPNITYCLSAQQAIEDTDAVIIMTEWPEFKKLNLKRTKSRMKQPVIVDVRNLFDAHELKKAGFSFATMGNGMYIH